MKQNALDFWFWLSKQESHTETIQFFKDKERPTAGCYLCAHAKSFFKRKVISPRIYCQKCPVQWITQQNEFIKQQILPVPPCLYRNTRYDKWLQNPTPENALNVYNLIKETWDENK